MCPYLREGRFRKYCLAYLGDTMEPSCYEEEYLCRTCSHTMCVWYLSKGNEDLGDGPLCPLYMEGPIGDPEILDSQLLMN